MNSNTRQSVVTRHRLDDHRDTPWEILVADDSEDDRAEVRRLLLMGSERRFRFSEAETGLAVLRQCADQEKGLPDCLILDYHLPDMNAEEVIHALRRDAVLPPCPIVVLTGGIGMRASKEVLRAAHKITSARTG